MFILKGGIFFSTKCDFIFACKFMFSLSKKKIHNFIRIIWVNSGSFVVLQAIFGMVLVTDCIHQVL